VCVAATLHARRRQRVVEVECPVPVTVYTRWESRTQAKRFCPIPRILTGRYSKKVRSRANTGSGIGLPGQEAHMTPEFVHTLFTLGYLTLAAAHVLYICYLR
jgi:hypothetical protein